MANRPRERRSPAPLSSRVPPQNIEAEVAVLGGILLDKTALFPALEILQPDHFYREGHRRVFEALIDLADTGEPVDLITVTERLRRKGQLDAVGGEAALARLLDTVATSAHVASHARIVKEKSLLRRIINVATDIAARGYEDVADVAEFLNDAESTFLQVAEDKIKPSFSQLREMLKKTLKDVEKSYNDKAMMTGVPSGLDDLDDKTSGFQSSDLIIIAGRPAMGKTSLALGIALSAARQKLLPVGIFSLEMSKEQVALRMLCAEAGVDGWKLRTGRLKEDDWMRIGRAAGSLGEAPIFVDDTPGLSVLELQAKARRLKHEHQAGLIVVDYLQLMRGRYSDSSDSREREISDISRSLKGLAKELGLPVIALSQLNRAVEKRENRRPQLADLRESGSIEQDADLVLFLYRDEVYNPNSDKKGVAEVIIGKHRNGPTGTVEIAWIPDYTSFKNLAKLDVEPPPFASGEGAPPRDDDDSGGEEAPF